MSLLDTVEPDGYRMFDGEGSYDFREELPDQVSIGWSLRYGRLWEAVYSRETVESLLSQCRKEALLEAVEVCKTIANDAEDCGATPEMLEIVYAIEDELRRMAESTMEGEKW